MPRPKTRVRDRVPRGCASCCPSRRRRSRTATCSRRHPPSRVFDRRGTSDAALDALLHLASIAWDHSSHPDPGAVIREAAAAFDLDPDEPRALLLAAVTDPVQRSDDVIARIRDRVSIDAGRRDGGVVPRVRAGSLRRDRARRRLPAARRGRLPRRRQPRAAAPRADGTVVDLLSAWTLRRGSHPHRRMPDDRDRRRRPRPRGRRTDGTRLVRLPRRRGARSYGRSRRHRPSRRSRSRPSRPGRRW